MNIGVFILIWTLSIFGTWIGRGEVDQNRYEKMPPKYQYITQIQTTENQNTSIQSSSQAQITLVTPMTNFNVNYNGKTNISVTKTSRTNRLAKTNK